MTDFYDKEGAPLTLMEWADMNEDLSYRIVEQTSEGEGEGEVMVSTVWLGLDHQFGLDGPPLIFETMVFGGISDGELWRYHTNPEAVDGHQTACAYVFGGEYE